MTLTPVTATVASGEAAPRGNNSKGDDSKGGAGAMRD